VPQAKHLSLDTILAGLDIWTATKGRMRDAAQTQVLLEMAAVRLARMDEILSVGQLASAISQPGALAAPAATGPRGSMAGQLSAEPLKKNDPVKADHDSAGSAGNPALLLTETTVAEIWKRLNRYLSEKSPLLANHLKLANLPAIFGPNSLAIRFTSEYNHDYEACANEVNTRKILDGLQKVTGQAMNVRFELTTEPSPGGSMRAATSPAVQAADLRKQLANMPIFRKAGEVLGAQIWHVDEEFNPVAPPRSAASVQPDSETDEM
jgi:DNA polymerase-3 subunit gamma/tau